jgi:hypothetical protein
MATATLNQSSPALTISMDVPHTKNTALVLEFRCLHTSDLRRKQKRWQDGKLKFHTFNKRVMVYDERSNFVGDTHWRKDYEFNEGEELQLERGGIMVEVGECVGKRDQDLTELVDKRLKNREERVAAKNAATPMRPQASHNPQTPAGSALLRPKSLNAVLGNPTGHYGKALLPNLSPFEQRQQAQRDENENERPVKRRKRDHTPPCKNGYAQSLMGTRLTLASSRPPSTATIDYEPFRPSIQQTPTATIDLTGDDDDHRRPEHVRPDTHREERRANKFKGQKMYKSPPARSGYATNLTGASLTLKSPESFASKRSVIGLGLNTNETHHLEETGYSSSVEPDSIMEDEASDDWQTKRIQKQKEPAKKRTKYFPPDPPIPARSSSPPETNQPMSLSKPTTVLKDKITRGSSLGGLTDQPVSTLRIKSRAPRRMMMLMDRPISRSSAPTESSDNTQKASRKLQAQAVPQDVVLSQATMRLDSFREQQDRRLQDRLNGKRPNLDSNQSSSSPSENDIDHHMIDNLLSRKTKEPKRVPPELPTEVQHLRPPMNLERASEDEEISEVRKSNRPGVSSGADNSLVSSKFSCSDSHSSDHAPSDNQEPGRQSPSILRMLPQSTVPSSDATSSMVSLEPQRPRQKISRSPQKLPQGAIPSTDATNNMVASETLITEKSAKPSVRELAGDGSALVVTPLRATIDQSEQELNVKGQENMASLQGPRSPHSAKPSSKETSLHTAQNTTAAQYHSHFAKATAATTGTSGPPMKPSNRAIAGDTTRIPVVPEMETWVARGPDARTESSSLPPHFSSTITSETEHFPSIIKCSAAISDSNVHRPSALEDPALLRAPVFEAHKQDPMSSEVIIKASPMPSPPMAEGLGSEAQRDEVVTVSISDTSDQAIPTVPNVRTGQPKAKLVNPATRGPTVQMTANRTVNTLVPAFNALPIMPPPLRTSIRAGRSLAQDESLENRAKERVKEVAPGGPWSRESFDLFGTWRPPGRNSGTSSVNG